MKPRITCFTLVLALLLIGVWARAETITVGPLTVQAAAKAARPGDVLVCEPSLTPYPGIRIQGVSGTADARITLSATPGSVTFSGMAEGARAVIDMQGSSYWNLVGLGVTKGTAGIYVGNGSNVRITACDVYGTAVQGIQTGSSSSIVIEKSKIHDITGPNAQHAVYYAGGSTASDNAVIDCEIWNTARAAVQGNAQGERTPMTGLRIEGNSIWRTGLNNQAAAINLIGVQASIVRRNYMYSLQAGGISLSGVGASGTKPAILSSGNLIASNDVFFNGGQGRQCVLVSDPAGVPVHSSNSVTGNNLRMGKSSVPAVAAVNGAIVLQDANNVLPVATTVLAGAEN